jgi:hypothetical protein
VTDAPDHRQPRVTLACACGALLELPPRAAEAAKPRWDVLHRGGNHRAVDPQVARQAAASSTFEGFIAAAGKAARS